MTRTITTHLRRLLAVAAWVLLIGGLFAMHGLGTHGAGAHDGMSTTTEATQGHAHHAAMETAVGEQAPPDNRAGGRDDGTQDGGRGHGGMGLLMLCVVILAAAIAVFTLVLLRHLQRSPLFTTPRSFLEILVVGRDRDPPDLLRLSVIRC